MALYSLYYLEMVEYWNNCSNTPST